MGVGTDGVGSLRGGSSSWFMSGELTLFRRSADVVAPSAGSSVVLTSQSSKRMMVGVSSCLGAACPFNLVMAISFH